MEKTSLNSDVSCNFVSKYVLNEKNNQISQSKFRLKQNLKKWTKFIKNDKVFFVIKPKDLDSLYFKQDCVMKIFKKSLNRLSIEYYVKN